MNLSRTERLLGIATVGGEWLRWGLLLESDVSLGTTMDRFGWFSRHRCDLEVLVAPFVISVENSR